MTSISADRPATDPPIADPQALHRAQDALLAEIVADGLPGLARILTAAWGGDRVAGTMQTGTLLRAVPQIDPLTCHELLRGAHLRDGWPVGGLDPAQRRALGEALRRAPRAHPAPH
jgi:hypothetical protein